MFVDEKSHKILADQIFSAFVEAWDDKFRMSLKPKRINHIINSYTSIFIMETPEGLSKAAMLDAFEARLAELGEAVKADFAHGCTFAVAWAVCDEDDPPAVQAIVMSHPSQTKAFEKHAFGETAEDLGLYVDDIHDEEPKCHMERWLKAAASILHYAGEPGTEKIRYITSANTLQSLNKLPVTESKSVMCAAH